MMTERNATEITTPPRKRLQTAANARWNAERSAEMWGQYADDITQYENRQAPSRIDRDMVDVIAVTDDGLEVLEPSGDRTPIGELLDESNDGDTADRGQEHADDNDGGAFTDLL